MASNDLILHKCREKVNETREDFFRVQVSRKDPVKHLSTRIGLFDAATLEMLEHPEMWVPKMFGGGLFVLTVSHVLEGKALPISGEAITIQVEGAPLPNKSPVMLDLIRGGDWLGPKIMIWPSESELNAARQRELDNIANPPAGGSGGVPSAANDGRADRPQIPAGGSTQYDPRYEAASKALEAEKLAWSEKVRALDDAKHKLELDNAKREADARMARLEAKLEAAATASPQKGPDVAAIIAAVAPIVAPILTAQNELRREMMHAEAKAREEQTKLFTMLLDKKEDGTASLKMATAMAESVQMINKMGMDMVHTMKETILGPEESGAVTAFKEIGKALILMGANGAGAPKLKALPSGEPASQPAQRARPAAKPRSNPVARIEAMIRAKLDAEIVADALFSALNEPEMQQALNEVGGNYVTLLQNRLGEWIMEGGNMAYLQNLGQVVQTKGEELGVFADDEEEDTEAEAEPEEGVA